MLIADGADLKSDDDGALAEVSRSTGEEDRSGVSRLGMPWHDCRTRNRRRRADAVEQAAGRSAGEVESARRQGADGASAPTV